MATSVGVNKLSIVDADTNGTSISFPDVCKTPSPGGPIPIPSSDHLTRKGTPTKEAC